MLEGTRVRAKRLRGRAKGMGEGVEYVDESDSDSDYECEDVRLEDSGDEIDGGEEAEGYDDMEVDDGMEGDEMDGDISFERGARSVCYGDYKTPPKKGDPKIGVVEFIDDKT
ncbi:hypothetical protein POM88_040428 [Heracleum sosnowskyi]|uniref:Uncharacterized protein n=1 Tax=Heracleum sosnowskyi TaxID=360622 RepID=A0AAD8HC09_9APIA|nr:hypothetical protein POM88_040428 [Heracleum sosnowskyi]